MSNNPIIPLDNFNIFQEVKEVTEISKIVVNRLEQGKETFMQYSFSDAVKELNNLFDK
ncbi:MAG: hypothetical protein ACFFAU_05700 [Candidatus Hodarchaeota archaeon]